MPLNDSLIETLLNKWKAPGISVGTPLVRLDEVIDIIRQHTAAQGDGYNPNAIIAAHAIAAATGMPMRGVEAGGGKSASHSSAIGSNGDNVAPLAPCEISDIEPEIVRAVICGLKERYAEQYEYDLALIYCISKHVLPITARKPVAAGEIPGSKYPEGQFPLLVGCTCERKDGEVILCNFKWGVPYCNTCKQILVPPISHVPSGLSKERDAVDVLRDNGFSRFQSIQILDLLSPYLAKREPVSVDLESVQQEYFKRGFKDAESMYKPAPVSLEVITNIVRSYAVCDISLSDEEPFLDNPEQVAKAVLDAAGVAYVD